MNQAKSITTFNFMKTYARDGSMVTNLTPTESIHRKNLKAITKKCSRRSIRWIIFRAKVPGVDARTAVGDHIAAQIWNDEQLPESESVKQYMENDRPPSLRI